MDRRWQRIIERINRIGSVLRDANVVGILALLTVATLLGGTLLWLIEGAETFSSPFDAIWWAIVTMTAVGYGDFAPTMISGRLVAMVVMLTGVTVVGVFTARVSTVLVTAKLREDQGLSELNYHNHLIIAGWFSGADRVIDALLQLGKRDLRIVLLSEIKPGEASGLLERYKKLEPRFVRGSLTDEATWNRAAVEQAWATLLMPDLAAGVTYSQADQETLLAALTVRKLNRKLKVYAYALDQEIVPHLYNAGADRVVLRDSVSPFLLASHAVKPGVPELVQEILSPSSGVGFDRLEIPRTLVGKTVAELENWVREKTGGKLIALMSRESVLEMSDILSDDLSSIDAFIKRKFEEAGRHASDLARNRLRMLPDPAEQITATDVALVLGQVALEVKGGGA